MSQEQPPGNALWKLFQPIERAPSDSPSIFKLLCESGHSNESDVAEPSGCAVRFDDQSVFWAMRNLPVEEAPKHFLACGTTGSGKTIAIKLFLQSIAPRFKKDWKQPEQLILFDAKCDLIPMLAGMGLRYEDGNVFILNPYDARSAVWNLGEAVQMPIMARALAALLIPEEKNSNAPFWSDAARELIYAVVIALNHVAGTNWSLRDLLCALDSLEHIKAVTARHPSAARLADQFLCDEKHVPSVLSTLASKLGRYSQVAALWETNRLSTPFSITEFLKKPGVLVLGNDPVLRDSIWPLNAILLKALVNEILRRPDTRQPAHWFVLDEFRAMERVDCIHDLLNRGRSKGASVMLGIQSIEGLMDVYGEHGANDILGLCSNKLFLRAGGYKTAEWAEKHFSTIRRVETAVSHARGSGGSSTTVQYQLHERSLFLSSFFLDLPFPGIGKPYIAVCDVPSTQQALVVRRSFDDVLSWCHKAEDVPSVKPRNDGSDQTLWPWTEEQERYFCGEPKLDTTPKNQATAPVQKESPPQSPQQPKKEVDLRNHPRPSDSNGLSPFSPPV